MVQAPVNLSVCILTRNEEAHIAACMESASFAQEFIVVDDGSTDKTVEIAKVMGGGRTKVFFRGLEGDFGAQKTFAIEQATCDWVFLLDADERVTPELASEIQEIVRQDKQDACYDLRRSCKFFSKNLKYGTFRSSRIVRLAPRQGFTVEGRVHESCVSIYPTKKLNGWLEHLVFKDWENYIHKINQYSSIAAKQYFEAGKSSHFFTDIVFRPFWAFLKVYIFNLGFLDGKEGFVFSFGHSFYTMLKYVKLRSLIKDHRQ